MRWFEFIRCAVESPDFEKYIDENWETIPDEEHIWDKISCESLEEDFIRRHDTLVNWDLVSKRSQLSEAFMDEYENCVNWSYISSYQYFGKDFANRHRYELDWKETLMRFQYPEAMILQLIEDPNVEIDLGSVLSTQNCLTTDTVAILGKIYVQQEIQKNLETRPTVEVPTEPEEKEPKTEKIWNVFRKKGRKHA